MSLNISDFIMQDFVYKQNPDNSYCFTSDGALELADRNAIVDTILDVVDRIFEGIYKGEPGDRVCNDYVLDQVLTRYSRDVFGELRLSSKIGYLGKIGRLTEQQQNNLSEFSTYGLKIDSCSPYIYRQVATLLYWFSTLKPFAVYPDDIKSVLKSVRVAFTYHNEFMSYLLILSILKVFNLTLNIHRNRDIFTDFLYDLHFRKLSRSSLEFFLYNCIKKIA